MIDRTPVEEASPTRTESAQFPLIGNPRFREFSVSWTYDPRTFWSRLPGGDHLFHKFQHVAQRLLRHREGVAPNPHPSGPVKTVSYQ
jgi:hypothetical protein